MTYDELLPTINILEGRTVTLTVGRQNPDGPVVEFQTTGELRVPSDPYMLADEETRAVMQRLGPQGFLVDPEHGGGRWWPMAADRFIGAALEDDGVIHAGFKDAPESGLEPLLMQIYPHADEEN